MTSAEYLTLNSMGKEAMEFLDTFIEGRLEFDDAVIQMEELLEECLEKDNIYE